MHEVNRDVVSMAQLILGGSVTDSWVPIFSKLGLNHWGVLGLQIGQDKNMR